MQQKYRVIPLGMSGLGNKVYRNGSIVTAECFDTPVEDLIKGGWLAPISDNDLSAEDELAKQAELDAQQAREDELAKQAELDAQQAREDELAKQAELDAQQAVSETPLLDKIKCNKNK